MPLLDPAMTILLVEDNEDDVFLMKRALKSADITNPLYIVEDGEQALEYLAGSGQFQDRALHPLPALVFLDLKLPYKSGHDVLSWIRRHEQLKTLIVVVLTSSEEPSDIRRSYQLGANSYVVKPPTAEQLLEVAKVFKTYWVNLNRIDKVEVGVA